MLTGDKDLPSPESVVAWLDKAQCDGCFVWPMRDPSVMCERVDDVLVCSRNEKKYPTPDLEVVMDGYLYVELAWLGLHIIN